MNKPLLTYENELGEQVKTSHFLNKRGSCCKTNCLHCPYGFTLKNHELDLIEISPEQIEEAAAHIPKAEPTDLASSLLGSAFGSKPKAKTLNATTIEYFRFVTLKETICGVVELSGSNIKNLYLSEHFKDQGISKDLIKA